MRDLKKLEETMINKRNLVEIEICVRECKVMTTGSERRSSADIALWWKKMQAVGRASYMIEQSFVSSNYNLINFKGYVTQAARDYIVAKNPYRIVAILTAISRYCRPDRVGRQVGGRREVG